MCGRFVTRIDASIEAYWSLVEPWSRPLSSWNVSPASEIPVILLRQGERVGEFLRWGLIPHWAHGEVPKYSTINARAETLETAASYRTPWSRGQRCIVPVLGFYEWQVLQGGKQPWYFQLCDARPFGLAALWDSSRRDDGEVVDSCSIITVPANPLVARVHAKARMPALLLPEDASAWLGSDPAEARARLTTRPAAQMRAWPVGKAVNSPRNDRPELTQPLAG